ncbi:MAG: hypothetical protein KGQ57_17585, partial [Burkholderiales bacterium]|nr:hypothetical protein [Burkholderiales bacterium]
EILCPPIDGFGGQQSIANAPIELVAAWSFYDVSKKRPSLDGAKPALRRDHAARASECFDGALLHELGDEAVLITPTVKHVAPELAALEADDHLFAATNLETLSLTMPGSFLDMPGVAMPSGVDRQGMPTSVLFSVPQGHDDRLLRTCLAIESAWRVRPAQ